MPTTRCRASLTRMPCWPGSCVIGGDGRLGRALSRTSRDAARHQPLLIAEPRDGECEQMNNNRVRKSPRSLAALDECHQSLRSVTDLLSLAKTRGENSRELAERAQSDVEAAVRHHEEFVEQFVHESLTSLAIIKGWTQLLQRRLWRSRLPDSAALQETAAHIDQAATRLAEDLRRLEEIEAQESADWPSSPPSD